MIVDELIAVLGYQVKGEGELKRFQGSIDRTTQQISALGVAAGTFVGTIAAQAFGRLADAVGSLPGNVIKVTAQFESLEASLTTVTGSAEQAKSAMDWITKFAASTPYEINGITEAFIKLKSYGIDPLADDALRTLGDAASAMNKPLDQAVEALADATSFEFERLKEFGLRTQQKGNEVTFTWTKNGKDLSKTIKKNSEEVRKFILEQLGDRFNGAMIRQSKTWNGMMSNLGDSWTQFLLKIGRGGFFDTVKGRLGQLLDYMGKLADNGTLDRWAKNLSWAFENSDDGAIFFLSRLKNHFEAISQWVRVNPDLWGKIKVGLAAIAAVKFPYLTGLLVIEDILSWMEGGDSVIGDFAKALSDLSGVDANSIGNVLATIGGSAVGIAAASVAFGGFSASVWPVVAALAALGGAYYLAKAFFDNMDAQSAKIKAVANPKTKPGYVEPANENRSGLNSNNSSGYLTPSDYGPGFEDAKQRMIQEEARRVGADKPAVRKPTPFQLLGGDYIRSDLIDNASKNFGRMGGSAAAVNSTVNDSRNQSVTVSVGGVTVQGVQNVSGAVGAAVGQAVGNGAAAGAKRATWHELGEKF